jgi:hypothetical protein
VIYVFLLTLNIEAFACLGLDPFSIQQRGFMEHGAETGRSAGG